MKNRLTVLALLLAITSMLVIAPFSASAAPSTAPAATAVTVPVTGSFTNGTFNGAYSITRFASQNGQLVAIGTLSGTLTDTLGNVIGTVTSVPVTVPVAQAIGSCTILDLILGPLHLNLLGLVVDLNQVHLTITAQQGAGNLLGNLRSAVAGLLDPNAFLTDLIGTLNLLLGLLNQINQLIG